MFNWDDMTFWQTGEWQVLEERMDDLKGRLNPEKKNVLRALDLCGYDRSRVMICGQDPYPNPIHATGLAFSIPETIKEFPPTLQTILNEYQSDLGLPVPEHGNLEKWAQEGVLLWNVIPTCEAFKSLSHESWPEWHMLTSQIIEKLKEKGVVFVFLGAVARKFATKELHEATNCKVLETAHPSPRGDRFSNNPFTGSRIFSRINDALTEIGHEPVNWRL